MKPQIKTSVRRGAAWLCTAALALALVYLSVAAAGGLVAQPEPQYVSAAGHVPAAPEPIAVWQSGTVRVNTADAAALQVLYGIGPVYAQAMVEEREANGPFFYPEDLIAVKGIGEKRLAGMIDQLDLSLDAE